MDSVRYYIALIMLSLVPPSILFWFSIHPFIRFWRAAGVPLTLGIHYAGMLMVAALLSLICRPLLSVEFGTEPVLIGLAAILLVFSAILRRKYSRHLRFAILTGLPELSPEKHKGPLLTQGIYARIRHPRYVQGLLGATACALFCNYLTVYLLLPTLAVLLFLLVEIEERELRNRYGAEYESYCARVPRFIPKLRRNAR